MTDHASLELRKAQELFRQGRLSEARVKLLNVAQSPAWRDSALQGEALEGLGYIAAKENDYAQASDYLRHACRILPPSAQRDHYSGYLHQCAGRHEQAVEYLQRSVAAAPANIGAYELLLTSLMALGQHAGALRTITALESRLGRPSAHLHYIRGLVFGAQSQSDAEVGEYRKALALNPSHVDAYVNLGVAMHERMQFETALQCFRKALAIDPDHAGARVNRARTNLLLGDFEHGWKDFEWRRSTPGQDQPTGRTSWAGDRSIKGKTLLIRSEGGPGDTLQFLRYLKPLRTLGPKQVILTAQKRLLSLLEGFPDADLIVDEDDALPPFDESCPIMSLPLALSRTVTGVPETPSGLTIAQPRIDAWADKLANTDKPRIGIAWQIDDQPEGSDQSINLEQWRTLAEVDACYLALQPFPRNEDDGCAPDLPTGWCGIPESPGNFADLAALIVNLDLVITADNAIAHLAGTLGKPVWVLLPWLPDWRWQLERDDSPWYPSARLFRQPAPGEWAPTFNRIRSALQEFAQQQVP